MTPVATPWRTATLERVAALTPRLKSLRWSAALPPHRAGQHVDVRLTADDGYQAQRSYSIASAPGSPMLELVVEHLDDGEVSGWLHEVAQPGDTLEMRGPLGGHFVWGEADGGPLLLLAGGSGIAPLMAMVRAWAAGARHAPVLLVHSARRAPDLAFARELRALQAASPALRYVAAVTRETATERPGVHAGRLDAAALRTLLTDWVQVPRHVFVCGSNRFVEAMVAGLRASDVPEATIRTERYGGAGD